MSNDRESVIRHGLCLIVLMAFVSLTGTAVAQETQYLRNMGPSYSTLYCQERVHEDYLKGTNLAIDPPLEIDLNEPISTQGDAFKGVSVVILPPGTVTPPWDCTSGNGCYDSNTTNPRGTALLWVPDGISPDAPRVLYVHGGSWWYGSPSTDGYATFSAKLARTLRMPVLTIDYTLAPVGHFKKMIGQVGAALNYLARHEPLDLLAGDLETVNSPSLAPPIFILGDSSGGGTALSALVAQASPKGLKGSGGAVLSGGVVYSPWINLLSDGPTYVSNLYGVHADGQYMLGDVAFGMGDVEENLKSDRQNAQDYMGRGSLKNPIANPFFAKDAWLGRLAPISFHVGQSETLLSESSILASRIARTGGVAEFHQYDGMWHVFPMYEDGCGSKESVVLAQSAYTATRNFLYGLLREENLNCGQTPCFYGHYEYPQGHDTVSGISPARN